MIIANLLTKVRAKLMAIPKKKLYLIIGISIASIIVIVIGLKTFLAIGQKTNNKIFHRPTNTAQSSPNSSASTTQPTTTSTATSFQAPSAQASQVSQNGNGSNSSSSSGDASGPSSSGSSNNDGSSSGLASCASNYSFFNTSPLNQADFASITPLGNLNPSGHVFPTDHIYFYLTNPASRYNLYAPGEATITQISASEHVGEGFTDYSIYFQPCNELKAYFSHVSSLSDKLSGALSAPYQWDSTYSTGGHTYRNYGKNTSLAVSASEQIGAVGGNSGQYALDMGAYDTRVTLNFANPSRWSQRTDTTHTVCPINYYSGDIKDTLTNKFGDYDGDPKRTIEPICGTIEQDVANTAQGVWFVKGTTSFQGEDPHLALAHDNINPTLAVFSVGTSTSASGLSSGTYQFSPESSGQINRNFDNVSSDGNSYCYQPNNLPGDKIILQLTSNTELKIEKQSGSCGSDPWNFTGSASEFER